MALGVVGSVLAGYALARISFWVLGRIQDPPSAVVLQFVTTFGVWLLAERLHLSAVITVVVYAITLAQFAPGVTAARLRLPTYAVWDAAVFILNVLAFVLIGLQLRPILGELDPNTRIAYLQIAGCVLAVVIGVRFLWIMTYASVARLKLRWFGAGRWPGKQPPTLERGCPCELVRHARHRHARGCVRAPAWLSVS